MTVAGLVITLIGFVGTYKTWGAVYNDVDNSYGILLVGPQLQETATTISNYAIGSKSQVMS